MPLISVLRDDRAAPAIVDADGGEIDILTNPVGCRKSADWKAKVSGCIEADVAVRQEDVVILECDRPVRREAEFNTGTDRATPSGLPRTVQQQSCRNDERPVFVGNDSGAALHVEQDIVPGVTDLAGEQAECPNL